MRPLVLSPLFAALTSLPGIGPKLDKLYARLLGREAPRVIDLLLHLPAGVIDRRARPKLNEVQPGQVVTVAVTVEEHRGPPPNRSRAPYRVLVSDDTGTLTLTFFHARKDFIEKLLPIGETRYVSGTAEFYDGMLQMVHPDRVVDEKGFADLPLVEPVYPLTEGLALGNVRRAMDGALARLPALPEWQDDAWLSRERFPAFTDALAQLHRPTAPGDIDPGSLAWTRLAYDELLAGQLALALVRAHMRRQSGRGTASEGLLRARVLKALPYALTHSQQKAVDEIVNDLALPQRMLRLLQGDVGSGKTVVALAAAASVIEAGRQAAMMAPTEILARQHLKTIAPLAEAAGIRVAILTGRERGGERKAILDRLTLGDIDLLIGTHALFQDDVAFHDLALAVVDEQHRFGVHQRLALTQKGEAVDVLVLTATPIPRTLVLTYFGDMDVSELREKPAGRQPIDTRTIPLSRIDEVEDAVARAIAAGQRAYWVCPLVEESEKIDLAAAQERHAELKKRFGAKADLVHGQMKGSEKDAAMARFSSGQSQLLVATTVIEDGVDVPEATIMLIEHAERFGLAQLHQLRGRIGRGTGASTCLLLYKAPLGETAKARLAILRETEDGFRIAEEDLKLRGEGDVLGTRQSGLPGFHVARVEAHGKYLGAARDDAALVLARDPSLETPRGEALRHLLYLFGKDEAIKLIRAG
ncbi:MAG: ATP-dependent DNA helicase RecG [Pseudolabrys sp.]|nr:ATP-dependent DNA helicase RecG [Pseudolabrys sp.]